MRQTLFYIPPEIFGVPLFGIGLLFWLILAVTLFALFWTLVKTKNRDDFWSALIIGAGAMAMVAFLAPAIGKGAGFPIRGYGVCLMLAIALSTLLVLRRGKKRWNIPPEILLSIAVVQVIFGILGARLFYIIEYHQSMIGETPGKTFLNMINLTEGGLVVFGSIIGGILASFFYLWKKKLPIFATLDLFAPALMLGIAVGRLGCFLNGCCFGGVCDAPPGVVFPPGSPAHYAQMERGAVSTGGFTLAPPAPSESVSNAKTLFGLKPRETAKHSLRSAVPGPVVIASVDAESEAETAGLTPGMRILRVGLIPSSIEATEKEIRKAETYPVHCNDDIFRFLFYEADAIHGQPVILFDTLPKDAPNDSVKSERYAFHAGPFRPLPVHPTQIYSSVSALALCFLLLFLERYCRRDGALFVLMLILYSLTRFGLEMIRTDESSFFGTGLTVSQCISLLTIAAAFGLFLLIRRGSGKRAYDGMFPANAE